MKTRFAGLLGLVAVAGLAVGVFGVAPFGGRTAEAMKAAPTMSVDILELSSVGECDRFRFDLSWTKLHGPLRIETDIALRDAAGGLLGNLDTFATTVPGRIGSISATRLLPFGSLANNHPVSAPPNSGNTLSVEEVRVLHDKNGHVLATVTGSELGGLSNATQVISDAECD